MGSVFLLIGTNKGDRFKQLDLALSKITMEIGTLLKASSVYETEPWGFEAETSFLNQLVEIKTNLKPREVLESILKIENQLGRKRNVKPSDYASREIDIDILYFNHLVIKEDNLVVPHPLIPQRRFTLEPLCELAPLMMDPVSKKTMEQMLEECVDHSKVRKLN